MRVRRVVHLTLLCLLALAQLAAPAYAQQDSEKRVRSMNKQAMNDYDSLEFTMARKTLMDAVAIIRQSGIDDTPVAAKTYLNLGIVYFAGFKDRSRGLQQFVRALRINPAIKLDPNLATPEIEEMFVDAKKQVGDTAPKQPDPQAETPADNGGDDVKGFSHTPIDEVLPDRPITIKALLGSDVGATRVYVLYRLSGQADYVTVPMKNTAGSAEWVGVIPADAVGDRPLQYYLEARDKRGRVVIGSGSAPNPYIVTLAEVAPGARVVRDTHEQKADKPHAPFHHLFVFVSPGFGFGFHPGGNKTEVAYQYKPNADGSGSSYQRTSVAGGGGIALSPFHIAVELGGNITNHFSLSVIGRFEVITGANAETRSDGTALNGGSTKATGAVAGLLRARYRFLEGRWHPYIHADIGGGEIRNALNLGSAYTSGLNANSPLTDQASANAYNSDPTTKPHVVCTSANCYDSLKLGYLFVGGGAGLWVDVWKYLAVMLDVNVLGAVGIGPGGQNGMNIDFSLGLGAHFL
ncbi:MAG: tetratricopeptide repeat protein [Polyangia bacterium]